MIPRWLEEDQNHLIIQANQCLNKSSYVETKRDNERLSLTFKKRSEAVPFHIWVDGSSHSQTLSLEWLEASESEVTVWIKPKMNQSSLTMDLICHDQSNVTLNVIILGTLRNFAMTRSVVLKKQSQLSMRTSVLSKGVLSLSESLDLTEEFAQLNHQILVIGSQSDTITVSQNVHHSAKGTESQIHNALVGNDASRIKFDIYGTIDKYQAKSKCYQHSKGIILGEQSWIEVDPKLIINEFDVEAGHGAAIGQMNPDELYYLTSRGLTEVKAKQLIIHGLTTPYLDALPSKSAQLYVQRQIAKKMGGH